VRYQYFLAPPVWRYAATSQRGRDILVDLPLARRIQAMKPVGYEVRLALPADVEGLPEIERLAGLLFKTHSEDLGIPEEVYSSPNSIDAFAAAQRERRLWVASGPSAQPVGFALVVELEGYVHLEELDVLPSYARQGIGSALLAAVCSWAKKSGYPAVTLRTFRDVPWNGPFYQRRGFEVVDSATLSPGHVALEASERQRGLRTEIRVTMAYQTAG
jgi:GNAT superfamily N-acetyltransferase